MTLTYDEIVKLWRDGILYGMYLNEVEEYLKHKANYLMKVKDQDLLRWITQTLIVVEIAYACDRERFAEDLKFWRGVVGRAYKINLNSVKLTWLKK